MNLAVTSFSEFMRTASSRRRKQVYRIVLQKASESQNDIIERAQDLETPRV